MEGRLGTVLVALLVPLVACAVLILPPVQLPTRILQAGYVNVAVAGAEIQNPDGTTVRIPEGAVARGSSIKITTVPQETFVASTLAKSLPAYLEVKSPAYSLSVQGDHPKESELEIPIPNDAEPLATLDLWASYGENWFKVPFTLNETDLRLDSKLNFVPDTVVVVQTRPQAPVIAAMLTARSAPPEDANKIVTEMNPSGLRLADEGAVVGDVYYSPETSASSPYSILPTVSNVDDNGVRTDLTENMLMDDGQRAAHVRTLVDLAVQKLYAGYNLQYEGLTSQDQDLFTAFVKELAKQLHDQNKILSVTLPAPNSTGENEWDTEGYDWPLIGRYADEVKIPLLANPRAFEGDTPLVDQYLQWATGQVDRNKLQVTFTVMGRDESGDAFTPVSIGSALQRLGPINAPAQGNPGSQVVLDLPKLREGGGIQAHEPSGTAYFNYKDDKGAAHTVWLEGAGSLAKKAELLLKYNLRGIALQDLADKTPVDPRIYQVLEDYRTLQSSNITTRLTVLWLADGKVIGKAQANDPRLSWKLPTTPGKVTLDVALSADEGQSFGSMGSQLALNIVAPTPTPVPTQVPTQVPTARPTRVAGAQPTPRPTSAAPPPAAPPPAAVGVNRFGYGMQLNWTGSPIGTDGEFSTLNGMGFSWAKIQVRWCDMQGSPGSLDTSALDNITAVAKSHGIKLLLSVVCGPSWTGASAVDGNPGPPNDPGQLAQLLTTIASRYCGSVGAIEVWNETNLSREWGPRPLNGADYLNYLRPAYAAIKGACPSMIVVSGAPTPTGVSNANAIPDDAYLSQMYAAGLKQYSDAIGIHPSGYNVPVD
ncbi:MAG: glycosyl hydrolase family 18 protein, partial [Rudaea sp.]